MQKLQFFLVALLAVGAFSAAFASPGITAQTPAHRLGFWLQDGDIYKYPAQTFFNAMFLTPPYPSSLEVMIFAIQQDQINHFGCSASTHYVSGAIKYWGQVAQMADSYPNIRLVFEVAYDPSSGGSGTYGLGCFNTIVHALGQYPSVYAMGVEGEYTPVSKGMTEAQMQTAMSDVTSTGKLFASYFIHSPLSIPAGGYDIAHTNFPAQGDQVTTLRMADSQTVGLSSGYYDGFGFPSTFTCPIGASSVASGALTNKPQGWNQCVVSTELSVAASIPASERQFVNFAPGFSTSGNFVGVSGVSTNQLWDNPTLRNWVWTDPNYGGNFILSTGSSAAPGVTVTTTSSGSTTQTDVVTTTSTAQVTTTSSARDPALATRVYCLQGPLTCGTITPQGVFSYPAGTNLQLVADPNPGHTFQYWHVCTTTCQNLYTSTVAVSLTLDTTATAVFA